MDFEQKRKHYRREFPMVENETYLNHAGHSPWSASSLKAMDYFMGTLCEGPMLQYQEWDEERDRTRSLMGRMLNCDADEIGFNYNTSLSLAMFSHSILWKPGDNIIVPDKCFPSVVMPAKLLERRGVEARVVESGDWLVSEDDLLGAIDERSKLMIVPLVNFLTGQRVDVARIAKECRNAGVFLVVDAIQAVGALKTDVKRLGCHALCFGSPKWMFGPMGVGTVYLDRDEIENLLLAQTGMFSVEDPWNFFDYDQPMVRNCRRFECGCPNHLGHYGINPNLEMFLDLGLENTEAHILGLTGYLHDTLTARGVEVITPREDHRRSGIVTFDAHSAGWDDANALLGTLDASLIRVSVRMGLVRVSPHFYNHRGEIDRLLEVVFRE